MDISNGSVLITGGAGGFGGATARRLARITIDMAQLPDSLRRQPLRQKMYRIDQKISNYWANPQTANLQQVSDTAVRHGPRHRVTVELSPNALQLIVLEPAGSKR